MKLITTLAHAVRSAARRSSTATQTSTTAEATAAAEDFVTVDVGRRSDGTRRATVSFTLSELRECGTVDELLRRAEERATPARPDPADFKGRPIGDYLDALGVPEDTSRYESELGVTTLHMRLGKPLRKEQ